MLVKVVAKGVGVNGRNGNPVLELEIVMTGTEWMVGVRVEEWLTALGREVVMVEKTVEEMLMVVRRVRIVVVEVDGGRVWAMVPLWGVTVQLHSLSLLARELTAVSKWALSIDCVPDAVSVSGEFTVGWCGAVGCVLREGAEICVRRVADGSDDVASTK